MSAGYDSSGRSAVVAGASVRSGPGRAGEGHRIRGRSSAGRWLRAEASAVSGHGDYDLAARVAGGADVMSRGGLLQREHGVQRDGEAAVVGEVGRQR